MGKPAESRSLLGHLINVSMPYDYTNPDWALFCQGITELTENCEPYTEEIQYICENTKTTNVKGFTVGFDLEIAYIKGEKVQRWANHIVRVPATGADTACDYIRFNKDEIMYGTNNQFIGVRRKATVYPNSIGGSADESLKTSLHVSASSDNRKNQKTENISKSFASKRIFGSYNDKEPLCNERFKYFFT